MLLTNISLAQTTVKGIFSDSLSKEPVPFATVAVTKDGQPSEFVMTSITDVDGSFKGVVQNNGKYQITLRSAGKQIIMRNLQVEGQKVLDLGTIYTADQVDTLGVVEVVALKPLVKAEAGKISYNTQADPESKTATVLDLLKKVPLVTVDGQDNISVNGNSSFQVHVNGKKNTMLTNRPAESFKAMPASSIKDIEIITDPGAKYDAEGVGGIINIITDRSQKMNQVSGSLKVGVNSKGQETASANLAVQKGKLAFSLDASFNKFGNQDSEYDIHMENLSNEQPMYTDTHTEQGRKGYWSNLGLQASYEVDTLNLISVDCGVSASNSNNSGDAVMQMSGFGFPIDYIMNAYTETKSSWKDFWAGIDYQRTFKYNPQANLTFSYKVWQGYSDSPTTSINKSESGSSSQFFDMTSRYQKDKSQSGEHTWQLDYSTPLSKQLSMESGLKYTYRPQASQGDYYNIDGSGNRVLNPDMSTDFKYSDNIYAAYLQFTENIKSLTLKAGVRYEYTYQTAKYLNGKGSDFDADYSSLVPNASLTYRIGMTSNVNFTYGMRISRPDIWQLNPYIDKSEAIQWSYGNENLKPEKYHNFSLGYGYFSMKHNVNLTLRYSTSHTGITDYSFYQDNIYHTTYRNATENDNVSFNAYYGFNLSKDTRFMLNGTVSYVDLCNPELHEANDGWKVNFYASINQTMWKKIKGSLGVFGMTKNYNIRGYNTGLTFGNLSFTKDFCNDKLSLSLSAATPLKKFRYLEMDIESATKENISKNHFRVDVARIECSLQWRFGKSNVSVKHTNKTIEREDVSSGGKGTETPSM